MHTPLHLPKKLVASIGEVPSHNWRIRIRDKNYTFLIDTGATCSAIPAGANNRTTPFGPSITAANGTLIKTYGIRRINFLLGLRREFSWEFIVTDVEEAIIGCDFLHKHHILVDIYSSEIIDAVTMLKKRGERSQGESISSITTCLVNRAHQQIPRDNKSNKQSPHRLNKHSHDSNERTSSQLQTTPAHGRKTRRSEAAFH